MSDEADTVGRRMKIRRVVELNWTLRDVGRIANVGHCAVRLAEKPKNNVSFASVAKMAIAMGMSLDALVAGTNIEAEVQGFEEDEGEVTL